jgi:hypothetical protein
MENISLTQNPIPRTSKEKRNPSYIPIPLTIRRKKSLPRTRQPILSQLSKVLNPQLKRSSSLPPTFSLT